MEEFSAFSHHGAGSSPKCLIRGYVLSQCLTEWNTTSQVVSCVLMSSVCIVCCSFDLRVLKLASSLSAGLQDFTLLYYFPTTILMKMLSSVFQYNHVAIIRIYRRDANCWLHLSIMFSLACLLLLGNWLLPTRMLLFKAFFSTEWKKHLISWKLSFIFPIVFLPT